MAFNFVCEECGQQYNKHWFNLGEDGEYDRKCKVCSGCKFLRCNRCPWRDLTTEQFDINKRTGAYLKTCRKCMVYSRAYSKQVYQANKEEDELLGKIKCGCGSEVKHISLAGHLKSRKHQAYLETL